LSERVFTHSSEVLPEHLGTLAAELDPTAPGTGHHLNFDQILRRCGHAWMAFLGELGSFGTGVIVPRVEVDYHREVGLGPLDVDLAVLTIGRTSFRVRLDVRQHGELAASAQVVLVVFDYGSRVPLPLTREQRTALAAHQD
jgi:acyl-CoA thioesterase FadM